MLPRLLHLALIAVLLASTTGVAVDAHYCMGQLVDLQIFADAKACGMSKDDVVFKNDEPAFSRSACCDDQTSFYKYDISQDHGVDVAVLPAVYLPIASNAYPAFAKTYPACLIFLAGVPYRPPPRAWPRAERQARLQSIRI